MSDLFCDPCLEEGNHIQAKGYCVDCTHHLCGICFLHHRRPKPWRHHQLLDKQLMPKSKTDKVYKDECTDKCATHGEEILRYFCEDHKLVGCTICVTLGHRACNVGYIPTLSKNFFYSNQYHAFEYDLESLADGTRSLQEAAARNLEYIGQHAERAKDKIRKLRKEVDTFFDDLEQKISDKVSKIQKEDQDKIEAISKRCESLAGMTKDLQADTEDKKRKNQKCRLFVDVQGLQDKLEQYKRAISTMEKNNTVRDLTFRPSERISKFIGDKSMDFGSLVDFCETVSLSDIDSGITYSCQTLSSSSDLSLPQSTMTNANPVWSFISGFFETLSEFCESIVMILSATCMAVLSGGRIAFLDPKNNCMTVIDTTHDRFMSMPLPKGFQIRITKVSDNDIALLCNSEIKLYSVTDQIKLTKTCTTSLCRPEFVYTKNSFVGFTGSLESADPRWKSQPTLSIVNMNGDVVKKLSIELDEQDLDDQIFLAVNSDYTAIYVCAKRTVTCLTFDGEVKSRYKYSSEWCPCSIAVSSEGLVFVCDCDRENIHILTSDLKEVGQIDSEKYNMVGYKGIGICSSENKLYVRLGLQIGSSEPQLRVFNI